MFCECFICKNLQNCVKKDMPDSHSFDWINSEMRLPKSSLKESLINLKTNIVYYGYSTSDISVC